MAMHAFETIDPPEPPACLPARIEQSSPRAGSFAALAALALTGLAIIAPFAAVIAHLAETPDARALVIEQPRSVLQLAFGLVVWSLLLGLPAGRLVRRLVRRRIVALSEGLVTVTEVGLTATTSWSMPIAAYTGLAHHVRASVSGVRHELVLRHDDPSRTVLIAVAPRFAQADVQGLCSLLGVREVPARLLYERHRADDAAAYAALRSQTA